MDDRDMLLQMQGITKNFPGVLALDNVDFDLKKGEVHCLVGENGAGKSTLIKILAGAYQKDEGKIIIEGKKVEINSPLMGQKLGIRVIYQELDLLPDLSVAENIFIDDVSKNRFNLIDWEDMYRRAVQILQDFNVEIDVRKKVKQITVAEQQIVAIAKTLSQKSRILVMDEPGAVLTDSELDRLFGIIKGLKKQGVGIIFITHRLEELFKIGDRVTVLRDGKFIATDKIANVDKDQIIKWMVGRKLDKQFYKREVEIGDEVLRVENLGVNDLLENISFNLRKGEILGISGLVGAGRTELLKTLFGVIKKDSGRIIMNGKEVNIDSPNDALLHGLALIPESRKEEGLVLQRSIEENISVGLLVKNYFNLLRENVSELLSMVVDIAKRVDLKAYSIHQEVSTLSGGNQQKVVISRWLASRSEILLLDEPTRGIDVGSKHEIYKLIADLVEQGKSVIMVSSELPEILGISDRILVMSDGQIKKEFSKGEATQEKILEYAIPSKLKAKAN